ncbi:MAG: single-stranded-DNA-specific exonuclease RecJ [Deltaproteobacteria bacterium]|jgi:single-stranded-DNA-specific exonuclease|nr:single-stranded-DNA-specific exonuclease RecJ [Deltaproteobacteria bacterium]
MLWNVRYSNIELGRDLALALEKPIKFGQFLVGRGFEDPAQVRAFIDSDLKSMPPPATMPGMEKAVEFLLEARAKGAIIVVSGDYDADGLTATALLQRVLGGLGFNVTARIPNRLEEGYGLSKTAVREIYQTGAGLIITVDSGVSDVEAVMEAQKLNLPVIITDHHQLPPDLPEAAAIINPHLGGGWESAPLAGVGVAFMLAWAVRNACLSRGLVSQAPSMVDHLSLVALGTIADLAPLIGPNRTMVQHGLKFLLASDWPGLTALRRVAKLENQERVSVRDVGFKLAPRLNAAGRLGSAYPALSILTTQDPRQAEELAKHLDSINRQRYESQRILVEEAFELLEGEIRKESRTVVLAAEGWPKGLLGLAASKVAEKSGKPTIMFCLEDGFCVGSGRTAGGFDLFAALSLIRGYCQAMGGHSQAAGLRVNQDDLEAFKEAFESAAAEQPLEDCESEILIDLEVALPELEVLFKSFSELEPFGQGNPAPVAVLRKVKVLDAVCSRGGRLNLRLSDGLNRQNVYGFNLSERLCEIGPVMDVLVVYDNDSSGYDPGWRLLDFRPPNQEGLNY